MTIALLDRLPLADARLVFDVGTGVGAAIDAMRTRAPSATIVGVDRSFGMLTLAPLPGRSAVMDAMNLAIASGTVDVAIAAFVLFHLPDPSLGIQEIARVLRASGAIGVATWGADADVPAWTIWNEELAAHGAAERDASSWILNAAVMDTADKLTASLLAAGFSSVDVATVPLGFRPDAAGFADLVTRYGTRERLDSLSPGARASCIERATRRLNELDPDDFEDQSEVLLATATRRDR